MNQHQDYDKIIKETIEKVGYPILQKIIGIEEGEIQSLPSTLPRTIERRADFLKMARIKGHEEMCIFHFEFQSSVYLKMAKRFLVYEALIYEKYELPVYQYVIYLGTGNWTAPTSLELPNLKFEYQVISLNKIDYELFLNSELPEEIILAILADFKKENNSKVISKIIKQLHHKTKNKKKLQKLIMQLEILSNLRNLQLEITKQLSTMSIEYDITKDLRFLEGNEQGREQEKVATVINGYKNGISIPLLSNISGLSESRIEEILKENNLL